MDSGKLDKVAAGPEQGPYLFLKGRLVAERRAAMSSNTIQVTRKFARRVGMSLLGTAAFVLPLAVAANAGPLPEIIRGIPDSPSSTEPKLAYQASFPNGSLESSIDKLSVGPMQPGHTGIAGSNPTFDRRPGEIFISIKRPVDLSPDLTPAMGLWATPVAFGPGSVSRISATFIAPVGPLPGGGFAIGMNAKTGNENDLSTDTRIAVTVNVRPDFVVRFGVPFGAVEPARVPLPQDVKEAMFSASDPQPFTIELTIDRKVGKGIAKLMVTDQVFTVPFDLSDFRADGGPVLTAVGPGIAVNPFAPGQTVSVRVRDFRIYANADE